MAKDRRIQIEFDQDIYGVEGSQAAFTVTSKVPKHVGGPLIDTVHTVEATTRPAPVADTVPQHLLDIVIVDVEKFSNAVGDITVTYDKALGTLQGLYGTYVASFSLSFTPVDLVPVPDPYEVSKLHISITSLNAVMTPVTYVDASGTSSKVSAAVSAISVTLTESGIIDP